MTHAHEYSNPGHAGHAPGSSARTWSILCHLAGFGGYVVPVLGSILLPLVFWLMRRDEDPFIDHHGREALNFQITLFFVYMAVFMMGVMVFLSSLLVGPAVLGLLPLFFVFAIVPLYQIAMIVVAAVKANEGDWFRYPLTLRLI